MKTGLLQNIILFIVLMGSVIALSCSGKPKPVSDKEFEKYKEPLLKANAYLNKKDDEIIKKYIQRRNWNMEVTGRGLYYEITKHGDGPIAEPDKLATINFRISLLDGTLCYTSDSLGPRTFRVTRGGVESGLEEGILLLHKGDEARFIMPPHLAYGLVGDDNKIPMRSIILYEVEVLDIADHY